MSKIYPSGSGSFVSVRGHPLHPMLVPFPIAFLNGVLVSDLIYVIGNNPFWATASFWLLCAGVVTGLLAALGGVLEATKVKRARKLAITWLHGGANVVAIVAACINLWLRWGEHTAGVVPVGIVLSVCVAVILAVSAWFGGELTFRHGVGVMPTVGGQGRPENERY